MVNLLGLQRMPIPGKVRNEGLSNKRLKIQSRGSLKCGPQTNSISIIWGLVRKETFQIYPRLTGDKP